MTTMQNHLVEIFRLVIACELKNTERLESESPSHIVGRNKAETRGIADNC